MGQTQTCSFLFQTTENSQDAAETFLLIIPSFFYMVVAVLLTSLLSVQHPVSAALLEFTIIVIPVILNVTVLSKYVTNVVIITCFLLGMHLLVYLVYLWFKRKKNIRPLKKTTNPNKKDYVTNIRATINLISVIAILAVDFRIFPVRYSKTHKTGFSLMDVGVGLYVFANGIVAPEVRGKKDSIKSSVKGSLILLIIGILRLILTKLTHYKVSDREYGVHWNFFITLAFTKIFSSCILNVIKVKYVLLHAISITAAHEILIQLSFKKWVFEGQGRETFLDANKEGIVSTIGYVALYMYSLYFAYSIKISEKSYAKTTIKFFLWTFFTLTMTIVCNNTFEVSRRLANAGYISWVLFLGIFMSWLFYLAENGEKAMFQHKLTNYVCSPYLYEAINYNGLIFFLIANVVTGLINLTIKTKLVSTFYSVLILFCYMFVNSATVFLLYLKQWKLKL